MRGARPDLCACQVEPSEITLYSIIFNEYDDRIRLAGLTGSDYIRIFCTDDYSVAAEYSVAAKYSVAAEYSVAAKYLAATE